MRNYLLYLTLILLTTVSCEKDDICIDATTPKLIIKFYDFDNQSLTKEILLDSVWAVGKNGIEEYKDITLDSIAIPLNISENTTIYIIENNSVKDTIVFSYSKNDIFVSRSCGYKTIFENLHIESNTINWIKSSIITNLTIENETKAHITIFH